MSADKRVGWLADLQVGDEVGVASPTGSRVEMVVVTGITPTGLITASGSRYNSNGMGKSGCQLVPAHEARQRIEEGWARFEARNLINDLCRAGPYGLPYAQLVEALPHLRAAVSLIKQST